ncbi:hypothetical protein FLW53_35110 [Microbispora sp. SCL1-1]|uniref:DUF6119 family protein n=1 Tax=Microbispora TaxID=2005 RepID=UPI00115BB745|nr:MULTISPECIES: DUF6119 family protein [unclassified Microbispora]NJP29341.1 TIGR04141 family sporadically distributed protein [Microbispora sp. CL1-1]TQS05422.1 hypothetical protein FLW53_35110 [Microbispora sp. SCL1-1]
MAPTTLPATVYRLTGITPTADAMFDATSVDRLAEPGVDVVQIDIAGAPALLYSRQLPTTKTGWCASLSQLTGIPLDLNRQDAEAVLIVGVDEHVYGIGFGQGYLSISDAKETGFGLRCALRAIDPLEVGDVVRRALGGVSRQDSTLVPGGIPIGGIGLHDHAELVKRLGGMIRASDLGLSHRKTVSIEGADGLRLSIPVDPKMFLALLRQLTEISEREVPPDFKRLEAIQPVPPGELRDRLNALLSDGLRGHGDLRLQVVVPVDLADRRHEMRSYRIKIGSTAIVREDLDLDDLRYRCRVQYCLDPVTALRDGRVEMCADRDGKERIAGAKAIRWIEATVSIGSCIYQLSDGEWYECGATYVESIRQRLHELITDKPELEMPPWRLGEEEEKDYNLRVQDRLGSDKYVCLDRKFIRTPQHRRGRGFEACDGFTDKHTLVHVKAADSSEPLSHQFTQALVSTQALFFQPEARAAFRAKVAKFSGGRLTVPEDFLPNKIVLAILLKGKELTPDSLYPFAQVALVSMADTLGREHGVTVEVVGIPAEPARSKKAA